MLLTFAYIMVNYYDSSIPGLSFSIKGFTDGGTINLVNLIGSDGSTTMLNEIHAASSKTGSTLVLRALKIVPTEIAPIGFLFQRLTSR